MREVIILLGITLGVAWRVAMPFFRKVTDGDLTLDEFDWKYVWEGIATLCYAVPFGAILYFRFVPPEASLFGVFLAAFVWGYAMQNLTDGGPAWIKTGLEKLGLYNPPANPGETAAPPAPAAKGKLRTLWKWLSPKNKDVVKEAEARLELVVFAPLQLFFLSALWQVANAVSTREWEVLSKLTPYILTMAFVSVLLLWGRNFRTWLMQHLNVWIQRRAEEAARKAERIAQAESMEGHVLAIQEAAQLVMHASAVLAGMKAPPSPATPPVPPPPAEG